MKKLEVRSILALLLAALMAFSLVACGGGNDTLPPETSDTEPVETDPPVIDPVETDPVETDPIVTDPVETDPPTTEEPDETDPKYDPIETDPPVTEPVETEPVETEPPHTHEFKKTSSVAATCQNDGYTEYTCSCGETKKDNVKPKTDHVYQWQVVTYASCTDDGERVEVCIYCGATGQTEVETASGHSSETRLIEIGSVTHHTALASVCKKCGEIDKVTPYGEHKLVLTIRVADENSGNGIPTYGYELYECECGYTVKIGANHKDGHFYYVDEGSGKYVCDCGSTVADLMNGYNGNVNAGMEILPKD